MLCHQIFYFAEYPAKRVDDAFCRIEMISDALIGKSYKIDEGKYDSFR